MIDLDKIEMLIKGSLLAKFEKDHGLVDTSRSYQPFTPSQIQQLHCEAQTYILLQIAKQLESLDASLTVIMRRSEDRENGQPKS